MLPPNPCWDITDFGLGEFARHGLTLVNLASEPEYCEKLMFAIRDQRTPCHSHKNKKEDIICRAGRLTLWLWPEQPEFDGATTNDVAHVRVNGVTEEREAGMPFILEAGSRVTLVPGVWHAFAPESEQCIIGEVSTANDDLNDNLFIDLRIGRFTVIEEDEPAEVHLISE
jgi:D-lyxose ketol-isomerase